MNSARTSLSMDPAIPAGTAGGLRAFGPSAGGKTTLFGRWMSAHDIHMFARSPVAPGSPQFLAGARRFVTPAVLAGIAGLAAACGSSSTPGAQPTVTVTVTATTAPASTPVVTPPPTPATPSGPPGCATTALSVSLGTGSGAAGSVYYPIVFTNRSSSACTLYGYPGVSFIAADGSQIGAAATRDPTYAPRLVTLAPGRSAHAELRVVDAHNYPQSTCKPVTASRLKVYPPDQTAATHVSISATACSNPSVPILSVQTVLPGSGAP